MARQRITIHTPMMGNCFFWKAVLCAVASSKHMLGMRRRLYALLCHHCATRVAQQHHPYSVTANFATALTFSQSPTLLFTNHPIHRSKPSFNRAPPWYRPRPNTHRVHSLLRRRSSFPISAPHCTRRASYTQDTTSNHACLHQGIRFLGRVVRRETDQD
jgi:hypothetical protein